MKISGTELVLVVVVDHVKFVQVIHVKKLVIHKEPDEKIGKPEKSPIRFKTQVNNLEVVGLGGLLFSNLLLLVFIVEII